jgi:hypothetical protein
MTERTGPDRLEPIESDLEDYTNSEAHIVEVVIARLTEEDLFAFSQESLSLQVMDYLSYLSDCVCPRL